MTSVTMGPGVSMSTTVMSRKAVNSSQFMLLQPYRFRLNQRVPNILLKHDLFRKPVSTFRDHALVLALPRLFADALDRDHALALGGIEYDHALRRAAGDADAVDRA